MTTHSVLETEKVAQRKTNPSLKTNGLAPIVPFVKRAGLTSMVFAVLGFFWSGLSYLKSDLAGQYSESLSRFHWLIPVPGTPIQVDEAGRFLKQLDGVNEVIFVSQEEILERLKQDPLLSENLTQLNDPTLFPPTWRVVWESDSLSIERQDFAIQEIRSFPGIADIAFDRSLLVRLQELRQQMLIMRRILSLGVGLFLLFFFIRLGQFLLFRRWKKQDITLILSLMTVNQIFWTLGYFLACAALAPISWTAWGGGFVVALAHAVETVKGEGV